jgi:hypothetical protein
MASTPAELASWVIRKPARKIEMTLRYALLPGHG